MKYLEIFNSYKHSEKIAYICGENSVTYKELMLYSDRLAKYILQNCGVGNKDAISVYGHKDFLMLVSFIACTKSGHPYCPMDISFTKNRVEDVLDIINSKFSIFTEDLVVDEKFNILNRKNILDIIYDDKYDNISDEGLYEIDSEDIAYIIFTSGSTGKPKGVQITYDNLNNYIRWIHNVVGNEKNKVYLNQAPFSFDLSVMDLYLSLYSESTLFAITKENQQDFSSLYENLKKSNVTNWVSTPSFADMCLSMREFSCENIKDIEYFLFCGEVLTKKTAKRLRERFPNAKIINTYGPTESTVCVTDILVTDEVIEKFGVIPLGKTKNGTIIEIREDDKVLADGEVGEIVIIGDTVSSGYYKNSVQTEKSFFITENNIRGYKTGDLGYFKDGNLFFSNRKDFQIKLNGYRIELGDIESNLLNIEGVISCCALPNYDSDNKVKSITAVVVSNNVVNEKEYVKFLKEELQKYVPSYMVPKKFKFLEKLPMNNNGKIDRKELKKILESK
ncbi:MAG: D-alanine--poly(phosphoribitol) ligase subunit DltA [Peptoniphilaceae bacterium]|uniref:D-alanine--poly(phosphoribitol) ligase subunit DltA n=1 Tax=Parvimonas sp. TaxID=1944660 RepID=UPI002A766578|nr:D-alanine--poly(phosphoribitol) ligase subunit DltA [Parvimonas sp.]MDD7765561.1 D-alanine--poly(phosphoribitol) ligase subunit DltA [Peptoniphilaceae bacterium]MDY3051102.1 D-alanine--poly(phosphoribitol) ligase subunit DltA [Parvimonas sp.]